MGIDAVGFPPGGHGPGSLDGVPAAPAVPRNVAHAGDALGGLPTDSGVDELVHEVDRDPRPTERVVQVVRCGRYGEDGFDLGPIRRFAWVGVVERVDGGVPCADRAGEEVGSGDPLRGGRIAEHGAGLLQPVQDVLSGFVSELSDEADVDPLGVTQRDVECVGVARSRRWCGGVDLHRRIDDPRRCDLTGRVVDHLDGGHRRPAGVGPKATQRRAGHPAGRRLLRPVDRPVLAPVGGVGRLEVRSGLGRIPSGLVVGEGCVEGIPHPDERRHLRCLLRNWHPAGVGLEHLRHCLIEPVCPGDVPGGCATLALEFGRRRERPRSGVEPAGGGPVQGCWESIECVIECPADVHLRGAVAPGPAGHLAEHLAGVIDEVLRHAHPVEVRRRGLDEADHV